MREHADLHLAMGHELAGMRTQLHGQQHRQPREVARPFGQVTVVPPQQPVTITKTGGVEAVKAKPGVVIKQIVKQEVGTKKARKKVRKKAGQSTIKTKRKEYTSLKKGLKKRLTQLKKEAFAADAGKIKALPPKERQAARKELRARIKKAHDERLKQLPALGKRKYNEIVALINKINKLKW